MPESPSSSPPDRKRLGPYSRTLQRGAIGQSIDGRSREGRFLRAFEEQLVGHVGGDPSATQRMCISRLARIALRLELLDEKITAGVLTDHDARVYGALHNSFRLLLREMGLKGASPPKKTLREHIAERDAARKTGAAPP